MPPKHQCFLLIVLAPKKFRVSQDILKVNPDGSAANPQAFQQHIRGDSQLMAQLLQVKFSCCFMYFPTCINWRRHALLEQHFLDLQNDPQLAQAILGDDINELQNILRSRHQQRMELKRKQEEELVRISLLNFYSLNKRSCSMKYEIGGFLCIVFIYTKVL